MNKLLKVIFGIVFTFLFAFTGIGYAQLTDNLVIQGTINGEELEVVYIQSISIVDTDYTSVGEIVDFNRTLFEQRATLSNDGLSSDGTTPTYVTYEIKVKNNSGVTMGYNMYISGSADNDAIVLSTDSLEIDPTYGISYKDKEFKHGEIRTFRVKVKFKEDVTDFANNILNSAGNFDFQPWDILPDIDDDEGEVIVVGGALERFAQILNTPAEYQKLDTAMDTYTETVETWWGSTREEEYRYDDSYISNVDAAHVNDVTALNELFEGYLEVSIDGGEPIEVKVMIKRINLDGQTSTGLENGNEMIIYMTNSELAPQGTYVPVYAAVFEYSSDKNEWYQKGIINAGEAYVKQYNGWPGTGSFDTDMWRSTMYFNQNGTGKSLKDVVYPS